VASLFAQNDSELDFGGGQDSMAEVLQKWGNKVQDALIKSVQDNTRKGGTGHLQQSIKALPVQFQDQTWTLQFTAADYWEFINEGVSGVGGQNKSKGTAFVNKAPQSPFKFRDKKPPLRFGTGLSLWANTYGFNQYAIRESIFREGIRATHFFDKVINQELVKGLVKELEKAGAKEVEIVLSKGFKAIIK